MSDNTTKTAMDAVMAKSMAIDFTIMLTGQDAQQSTEEMEEWAAPYVETLRGIISVPNWDVMAFVDGSFAIIELGDKSSDTIKTAAVLDPQDLLAYIETLPSEAQVALAQKIYLMDGVLVLRFDRAFANPSPVYDRELSS